MYNLGTEETFNQNAEPKNYKYKILHILLYKKVTFCMWKNKPKQYKVDRIDWGKLFVMWMTDKEYLIYKEHSQTYV